MFSLSLSNETYQVPCSKKCKKPVFTIVEKDEDLDSTVTGSISELPLIFSKKLNFVNVGGAFRSP